MTQRVRDVFLRMINVRRHIMARIFISFVSLFIVFILSLSALWYFKSSQTLHDTMGNNVRAVLSTALNNIDQAIYDVDRVVKILVQSDDTIKEAMQDTWNSPSAVWFARYNRLLNILNTMLIHQSTNMSGIALLTRNGHTCIAGAFSVDNLLRLFDQGAIETISQGKSLFLAYPRTASPDAGSLPHGILIARPFIMQGEPVAILVSELRTSVIKSAINSAVLENAQIRLMDANGNTVYTNVGTGLEDGSRNSTQKTTDYTFEERSVRSQLHLTAAYRASSIALDLKSLRTQAGMLILLSTIIVALASVVISRTITSGLKTLLQNIQADGQNLKSIASQDEVGEINLAFHDMIERNRKLMEDIRNEELSKRLLEIEVLQAQVAPHFLYNALNNIAYLARLHDAENIESYSIALINLLQGAVARKDELIHVRDEIDYVRQYLYVQQFRTPRDIDVSISLEPGTEHLLMMRMLLQPIVENAVIHGLKNNLEPEIHIRTQLDENMLTIVIRDNGEGIEKDELNTIVHALTNTHKMRFTGVGLANVQHRIQLKYGTEFGIVIRTEEGVFTEVWIRLPRLEVDGA